jgi:tetratricopeptide (TPR) repeat protein
MPQIAPRLRYRWLITIGVVGSASLCVGWVWNHRRGHTVSPVAGSAAYARGDFPRAAELARATLKKTPDDTEALRLLARSTARMGRHVPANALFARLGAQALQAEDRFLLGIGLRRAGQIDDATRVWEEGLRGDPNHAETIEQVIDVFMTRNLVAEAAELAERLARQPGWELRGELRLATLRAEMSDPESAAALLRRALERPEAARLEHGSAVRYRNLLARCLLKIGEPAAARAILQNILRERPHPEASWLLSRAALQQGATTEAIAALAAAGSYRAEHPMELEPSPYVGESRCASCHQANARSLQMSRHSSTFIRGKALLDLPYPDEPLPDPDDGRVTHRFRRDGNQMRQDTTAGETVYRAIVDYALGSPRKYFSLVGHDVQGSSYILRMSHFHTDHDAGWVRTTGHTPDVQDTQDFLGKPIGGADGVFRCLFCHVTDPKVARDRIGPAADDAAIGCERCHGPGGNHVRAIEAKLADPAIVNPARASGEGRVRVCAQCHANHLESPLPRTDPFWVRFPGTTITWSRCYTESAGTFDCMTCHDAHHDNDRSQAHFNGQCVSCHFSGPSSAVGSASKTPQTKAERRPQYSTCPVSPTDGCVGCHMPSVASKPLHATFTDHFIRVHPTSKMGKSP